MALNAQCSERASGIVIEGAPWRAARRYSCLAASLLPVPYWEWDALGRSQAAKQEYLRAGLRGAPSITMPEARSEH